MCSDVKNYFDNSAAQYTERSSSPLWRWQRSRELSAVSIFLGEIKGIDVLDLGCGAGFYTRFCIEGGARQVISVDFSSQMVDQLPKGRVMPIVSEAEKVKLGCRVAKIICAGLLEFVTCPLDVLTNARNLIASDGFMVCLVPPAKNPDPQPSSTMCFPLTCDASNSLVIVRRKRNEPLARLAMRSSHDPAFTSSP
jgi:SAM-dependent methyltransferase